MTSSPPFFCICRRGTRDFSKPLLVRATGNFGNMPKNESAIFQAWFSGRSPALFSSLQQLDDELRLRFRNSHEVPKFPIEFLHETMGLDFQPQHLVDPPCPVECIVSRESRTDPTEATVLPGGLMQVYEARPERSFRLCRPSSGVIWTSSNRK